MMRFGFAVIVAGLSLAGSASAAGPAGQPQLFGGFSFTSRKEPIEVTSKHLDFDYNSRRTVFRGNVEVTQGEIHLTSDTLTVEYEEIDDQQRLRGVRAEGNVTITQGLRRATGERAVFDQETRTLVLTGRAMLEEGANQLNGDTIVVYPDESRMEVKGDNSRVKLIIFPGETSPEPKPDAEAPSGLASPEGTSPSDEPAERP